MSLVSAVILHIPTRLTELEAKYVHLFGVHYVTDFVQRRFRASTLDQVLAAMGGEEIALEHALENHRADYQRSIAQPAAAHRSHDEENRHGSLFPLPELGIHPYEAEPHPAACEAVGRPALLAAAVPADRERDALPLLRLMVPQAF